MEIPSNHKFHEYLDVEEICYSLLQSEFWVHVVISLYEVRKSGKVTYLGCFLCAIKITFKGSMIIKISLINSQIATNSFNKPRNIPSKSYAKIYVRYDVSFL
jgi:hypothetical protein